MKKDIKEIIFWTLLVVFVFYICFNLGTTAVKNIRMTNNLKETDVCIEINDEIYCRLDYNIILEFDNA